MVPNIEFETFDYTGRDKKREVEQEVTVEQVVVAKEDVAAKEQEKEEQEMRNLVQRFGRMRSTSQSSLIQVLLYIPGLYLLTRRGRL